MELPYTGRAIFDDNFGNITTIIPTKKNWFIIAFVCVWIGLGFLAKLRFQEAFLQLIRVELMHLKLFGFVGGQ
jgi:hypothetical protein